jgi:putative chitobiose transport system substrate-binding protein
MIKTWQRFSIFTLIGLLLTWLVSCSNPSTKSVSSGAEVEFWTMQLQPQYTSYFNNLISSFEKQNPDLKVRWVDVPWSGMQSKILSAVSAKTAPDVVNLNPDFASQLAAKNAWLDLDTKITPEIRNQYLPNIWLASSLNKKSFGIPWYLTTNVTIYNRELLNQAGVTQPPVTYDDLAQVAEKVKQKTGKYAFFMTFVPNDSNEVLESLVQMGVILVDAEGKAGFNSPEGKKAFQFWVDLYKKGLLPKEVLTQGHRHGIELYQAGESAILLSGSEILGTIDKNAPKIAGVSAVSSQVTGQTGKKNVAVMNLVISNDSKKPDNAVKFALFVTNNENQLSFAKAANVLPSTIKAVDDVYFQKAGNSLGEQARIISAKQLKDAVVLVPAMNNLKLLQKAIYENLQAAMLGQKTVDMAIADAAKEWNQSVK